MRMKKIYADWRISWRRCLSRANLCVIGSEAAIEKNEERFLSVKHLIGQE